MGRYISYANEFIIFHLDNWHNTSIKLMDGWHEVQT